MNLILFVGLIYLSTEQPQEKKNKPTTKPRNPLALSARGNFPPGLGTSRAGE